MKQKAISSVTLILVGNMLTTYNNIGSGWTSTITAIIGFVLFFIGLGQLKSFLDETGQHGIKLLTIAAIFGIIALFIGLIPLLGKIIAGIIYIAVFIIQFYGFIQLKKSAKLGAKGIAGVNNLLIAMVLVIAGAISGLIPALGNTIKAIFSLIAFILILLGWLKIQEGVIEQEESMTK